MIAKIKILLLLLVVSSTTIFAQAPKKMSYQAVIRNTTGTLVANTNVGLKISILKGSVFGTAVYEETHAAATNDNGLVSIEIGTGNMISGDFGLISWGNDAYFIKTETDPTGGSNYTISGTNQLLSVPYALYAEKTKNPGKTTVYIQGYITDAQAAAILSEQLGPNTENVYIINTNLLTTVNLDTATSLVKLTVNNNAALTSISGNGVKEVYDEMLFDLNPNLSSINFNSLDKLSKLTIKNTNTSLTDLSFNNLTTIGVESKIYAPNLTSLNLPNLFACSLLEIRSTSLTTLDIPLYYGFVSIYSNPNLTSIHLPNLISGDLLASYNQNLTSLDAPNLAYGNLSVGFNSSLQQLSFPNLVNGNVLVVSNPVLTSLTFPSLTTIHTGNTFELSFKVNNNKLSSASVNNFLHQLLSITPSSGKKIYLNQNPVAPPIGQGLIDKATLISTGNTVTTD